MEGAGAEAASIVLTSRLARGKNLYLFMALVSFLDGL
jgi:hypothetical protein